MSYMRLSTEWAANHLRLMEMCRDREARRVDWGFRSVLVERWNKRVSEARAAQDAANALQAALHAMETRNPPPRS